MLKNDLMLEAQLKILTNWVWRKENKLETVKTEKLILFQETSRKEQFKTGVCLQNWK